METEWLILADAAEVVNGKLYLLGGGWDVLWVNTLPIVRPLAVAAAFRVPWNETNQRRDVEVEIHDEDGKVLVDLAFQIEAGRPAGIPPGSTQRAQVAANLGMQFQKLGECVVVCKIDGHESQRSPFRVVAGPGLLMQRQVEPGGG